MYINNPLDYPKDIIHWITDCECEMGELMETVVELPEYIKRAEELLEEQENKQIISWLAENPTSGTLIQGTGGIRKIRWARNNGGKSGGVRIIYYYHNETIPLFLLSIFGKNEKENLSHAERNQLAKLTKLLVATYGEKHGK